MTRWKLETKLDGSKTAMENQQLRLDLYETQKAKSDALDKVVANATEEWKKAVSEAVYQTAMELQIFTVDDVNERIPAGVTTHELRAMGGVLRNLSRNMKWFSPTDRYGTTRKKTSHAGARRIYKSLIYLPW